MPTRRRSLALARYALLLALSSAVVSGVLYPGGTVLDSKTRGYSFTHNFLSDLGGTVAFNDAPNTVGAALFGVAMLVGVLALAVTFVAAIRSLSAGPRARPFALLAAAAAVLVCVGFAVVALTPLDRAFDLHILATRTAIYSFPVATALLATAALRDGRFRARAAVAWATLAIVLVAFIAMAHLGPSVETERGVVAHVISQKIMASTVIAVLWIESREVELASVDA